MQSTEQRSAFPWNETLKLGARVAASISLLYLSRSVVVRVNGGETINRGGVWNHRSLKTHEEILMARFYREADAYLKANGFPGLDVAHEGYAVSKVSVESPQDINEKPHHRPDFIVGLRGTVTRPQPAIVRDDRQLAFIEVGSNPGSRKKRKQAGRVPENLCNYQQLSLSDIIQLLQDLRKSPWETILSHMGNIF